MGALLLPLSCLWGCKEKIDNSARYVFQSRTVMGYLEAHPAYSEYVRLLKLVPVSPMSGSTVGQLLAARGHYTVFAPTNEAIAAYLQSLTDEGVCAAPSWDAFQSEEKRDSARRVVVMNSLIDGGDNDDEVYGTGDFPQSDRAEFPLRNFNDKRLYVHYVEGQPDSVYINGDCPVSVTERDIPAQNGVIHQVGKVVAPRDLTAGSYILKCLQERRGGYLVMFRAIQACGLLDTLSAVRDEVYEHLYLTGKIKDSEGSGVDASSGIDYRKGYAPRHRFYGFTLFAEPDEFWRAQGLDPQAPDLLEKLTQWITDNHQYSDDDLFTADADYASEASLLYQWTTYHILPERLSADRLVFHRNELGYSMSSPGNLTVPVYELYSTLGARRLLKIYESKQSDGVYLNRFANQDNGRRGTGFETSCDPDKAGCRVGRESPQAVLNDLVNCCIYPIDAPLSYDDRTRDNLQRQRLRFDVMSLFPEALNNDIRLSLANDVQHRQVLIPNTVTQYDYLRNLRLNEEVLCIHWTYPDSYFLMNSDETKCYGYHEMTLTLPPVPRRGVYELRYSVSGHPARGIDQFYFGSDPDKLPVTGIPVNLSMVLSDIGVGWEQDTGDDDYDAEVDRNLRNNGYMRGPFSIGVSVANSQRRRAENVRHILWRGTMDPDKTYYLRMKGVLGGRKEGFLDFLELCAKEVYDNPERPEDIW